MLAECSDRSTMEEEEEEDMKMHLHKSTGSGRWKHLLTNCAGISHVILTHSLFANSKRQHEEEITGLFYINTTSNFKVYTASSHSAGFALMDAGGIEVAGKQHVVLDLHQTLTLCIQRKSAVATILFLLCTTRDHHLFFLH